ncbi:MAG: hypothetical protein ABL949_04455 [Fimbriimonadaceae bacterium]
MIDWQSYVDGTMNSAEREALNRQIQSDVRLQTELNGFKAFRTALKEKGQGINARTAEIEQALVQIGSSGARKPARRMGLRLALGSAMLATLAFAFFKLSADPINLMVDDKVAQRSVTSESDAAQWLALQTNIPVPKVSLEEDGGRLVKAVAGHSWASYVFEISGSEVSLIMSKEDRFDEFSDPDQIKGLPPIYHGKGLGWRGSKLSYYLLGPSDVCNSILRTLCNQTYKPKRGPGSSFQGPARAKISL